MFSFLKKHFLKLLDSFCDNLKDQFQLPVYLENFLNSLLETRISRFLKQVNSVDRDHSLSFSL